MNEKPDMSSVDWVKIQERMEEMVCVYFPGGGGTWAPVITTKEQAKKYVASGDARMPLGSSRKVTGAFK
jgi:hypothetical protein